MFVNIYTNPNFFLKEWPLSVYWLKIESVLSIYSYLNLVTYRTAMEENELYMYITCTM